MIEELASRVFYARDVAHHSHWTVTGDGSYADHQALAEFYDGVISTLDDVVEAYQGAHGLIGPLPQAQSDKSTVLEILKDDSAWIEKNHDAICQKTRAVGNLLDNLSAVYLKAIYKLEHLR